MGFIVELAFVELAADAAEEVTAIKLCGCASVGVL